MANEATFLLDNSKSTFIIATLCYFISMLSHKKSGLDTTKSDFMVPPLIGIPCFYFAACVVSLFTMAIMPINCSSDRITPIATTPLA